jgi:hypothetical protein
MNMNTGYNNYYTQPPAITSGGPTGGTSIYALKYNNQQHNNTEDHNIRNIVNNINTAVNSDVESRHSIQYEDNIDNEECDIDDEIDEDDKITEEETEEYVIKSNKKHRKHKKNNKFDFRDPILLWLVYMMLSQGFIKDTIGKYVPVINPNDEGVVGLFGIGTYGIILVVIYFVLRYIFI